MVYYPFGRKHHGSVGDNLHLLDKQEKRQFAVSFMKYVSYLEILEVIAKAAEKLETAEIYYPKTDNSPEGWREVEPYSLTTDIGPEGEHLVYGQDRLSPGHIFNAFPVESKDNHCHSFIVGKIKNARLTRRKFKPRNNWKVEF